MTVLHRAPAITNVPVVLPELVDQQAATDAVATEAGIVTAAMRGIDLREARLALAKRVLVQLRAA